MYTREIQAPAKFPVIDGKPIQGTWTRPFEKVNLLDTVKPFSVTLPHWLLNFRIKEWQSLIIQNNDVIFESFTANFKLLRFIEAAYYNKKTDEIRHYYDCFPFALWELPMSLDDNGFIECRALGYSMAIHNKLSEALINFSFDILPMEGAPGLDINVDINVDAKKRPPLVTNLLFSEARSVASYKHLGTVSGQLDVGEDIHYLFEPETTIGLFRDCKGFFPYVTRCKFVNGFGFQKDGRIIGFSMTENRARSANKDNENAFWVNGALTALPPVRITHAEGIDQNWVIEDVEGMVDLLFTPKKQTEKKGFDILVSKTEFYNPIGVFNGEIRSKDGETIHIRNCWGCAESLYFRV